MKHLAIILCAASVVLSGCAGDPVRYYAYQEQSGRMDVAWQQCDSLSRSQINAVPCPTQCQTSYYGAVSCGPNPGCTFGKAVELIQVEEGKHHAFLACMSGKGFLPCGQGGLHLPECQ